MERDRRTIRWEGWREGDSREAAFLCGKEMTCHSQHTARCVHNDKYRMSIVFTIPAHSTLAIPPAHYGSWGWDWQIARGFICSDKFVNTHALSLCLRQRLAVRASMTVWVSCHKDWLCATVFARMSWCMSSAPSDQASFRQTLNFGGVSFPDPIRCCQSHKLNTLFILSLSLSFLSLLVTRPLSNTYSNHSLFQVWVVVFFFSYSFDLFVERESHLVSFRKNRVVFDYILNLTWWGQIKPLTNSYNTLDILGKRFLAGIRANPQLNIQMWTGFSLSLKPITLCGHAWQVYIYSSL